MSSSPPKVVDEVAEVEDDLADEQMPRLQFTRKTVLVGLLFVATIIAFIYFVLPQLLKAEGTFEKAQEQGGNAAWIAGALLCWCCSWLCYNALFRAVCARGIEERLGYKESFQITLAALAATRLFSAGGAGGIALTAWALRRTGMPARIVACRMTAFIVLLYSVFMVALVVVGLGLYAGILAEGGRFGITVIPAILGATVIAIALAMAAIPGDFERRLRSWATSQRQWLSKLAQRFGTAPASVATGVRTAIDLVRQKHPGVLGAPGWWAFDMAILYCCFRAFGEAPPIAVLIMAYYVGMLGNLLPLPGGIGGVDGAMIFAFTAFGVSFGLAAIAVAVYRLFSFLLPTIPGILAYLKLRKTVQRWRDEPLPNPLLSKVK